MTNSKILIIAQQKLEIRRLVSCKTNSFLIRFGFSIQSRHVGLITNCEGRALKISYAHTYLRARCFKSVETYRLGFSINWCHMRPIKLFRLCVCITCRGLTNLIFRLFYKHVFVYIGATPNILKPKISRVVWNFLNHKNVHYACQINLSRWLLKTVLYATKNPQIMCIYILLIKGDVINKGDQILT